jgi:hypothetical protein
VAKNIVNGLLRFATISEIPLAAALVAYYMLKNAQDLGALQSFDVGEVVPDRDLQLSAIINNTGLKIGLPVPVYPQDGVKVTVQPISRPGDLPQIGKIIEIEIQPDWNPAPRELIVSPSVEVAAPWPIRPTVPYPVQPSPRIWPLMPKPDILIPSPRVPLRQPQREEEETPVPDLIPGVIDLTPGYDMRPGENPRLRIRLREDPGPKAKPRRSEENVKRKDVKVRSRALYLAMMRLTTATFGTVTEVLDFYDALKWNLYLWQHRDLLVPSFRDSGTYYRLHVFPGQRLGELPFNAQRMVLRDIATGYQTGYTLDFEGFALDFANNQVQDLLIGRAAKAERSAIPSGGLADFGQLTKWINRVEQTLPYRGGG